MPDTVDKYSLPAAPAAFETAASWKALSNSVYGRADPRKLLRGSELAKFDQAVKEHAAEHGRLAAEYSKVRDDYARTEDTDKLSAAALVYARMTDSLKDIHNEFRQWLEKDGYRAEGSEGAARWMLTGRNANSALYHRSERLDAEMQSVETERNRMWKAVEEANERTVERINALDNVARVKGTAEHPVRISVFAAANSDGRAGPSNQPLPESKRSARRDWGELVSWDPSGPASSKAPASRAPSPIASLPDLKSHFGDSDALAGGPPATPFLTASPQGSIDRSSPTRFTPPGPLLPLPPPPRRVKR